MNPIGLVLVAVTALFPFYQLFSLPDIAAKIALFSQCLGLVAIILMAWGQIWATRMPGVENLFGGLDRVYVLHKWAGIIAMAAILFHDTIDADMEGLGTETAITDLAETLGEISLYGLLILVVLSVATFIPYHLWKWTHKAMGALFAAGVFHFIFILKPFAMTDPAGLYAGFFCGAGLLAYVWTLLPDHVRPSQKYNISALEETGGALAITLRPEKKGVKPAPGQFGIFYFTEANKSEPHPFSFSKIFPDGSVRVTIKALGDFTSDLSRTLKVCQEVRVQGPYGRFRLTAQKPQIWIAGGIGITPFLAWADALKPDAPKSHLFYCVRSEADAPHLSEIERIAASKPNLTLDLFVSKEGKRLAAEDIAELFDGTLDASKVSFCGPVSLRKKLQSDLQKFGVGPREFHYEEFEFRTGIGLKELAAWIVKRGSENVNKFRDLSSAKN